MCIRDSSGARRYALMRLSMKSHSIYELRDQLEQKGMSAGIIEQVIEEFIKQGYLNDQEWVDAFIRGQQSRHTGPRSIQRKLRQKGISEDQIREALLRAGLKENQGCQIKKLLTARYKSKDLNDLKQKQKVIAALIRKGFDLDEIFRSIQTAKENPGF